MKPLYAILLVAILLAGLCACATTNQTVSEPESSAYWEAQPIYPSGPELTDPVEPVPPVVDNTETFPLNEWPNGVA